METDAIRSSWICPRTQFVVTEDECRAQRRFCRYCASCIDGKLIEFYATEITIEGVSLNV